MTNTKRTRFKLTLANNVFFGVLAAVSIFLDHTNVTMACITQIGLVQSAYTFGETKRSSTN